MGKCNKNSKKQTNMLNIIFKYLLLWKKKKLLHEITLEDVFLSFYYRNELESNLDSLVEEYEAMKSNPLKQGSPEVSQLQARIVETAKIKDRLDNNHKVKHELELYISAIKES